MKDELEKILNKNGVCMACGCDDYAGSEQSVEPETIQALLELIDKEIIGVDEYRPPTNGHGEEAAKKK